MAGIVSKVYKVVHWYSGVGYSSAADGYARVMYRIGETSRAPMWLSSQGYHLLAYDNLNAAREHRRFTALVVLLCDAELTQLHACCAYPRLLTLGSITTETIEWGAGIVACRWIKPLEVVPCSTT